MATIPRWLIGKHVTAVAIHPITVAADGTITDGSAQSLVGKLDEIGYSYRVRAEEINALDSSRENNVKITGGNGIRLTEILRSNGTNILAGVSDTSDHVKVTFTRGGQTHTMYGLVVGYNETIRRGKSVGDLTVDPIDAGEDTYAYS